MDSKFEHNGNEIWRSFRRNAQNSIRNLRNIWRKFDSKFFQNWFKICTFFWNFLLKKVEFENNLTKNCEKFVQFFIPNFVQFWIKFERNLYKIWIEVKFKCVTNLKQIWMMQISFKKVQKKKIQIFVQICGKFVQNLIQNLYKIWFKICMADRGPLPKTFSKGWFSKSSTEKKIEILQWKKFGFAACVVLHAKHFSDYRDKHYVLKKEKTISPGDAYSRTGGKRSLWGPVPFYFKKLFVFVIQWKKLKANLKDNRLGSFQRKRQTKPQAHPPASLI